MTGSTVETTPDAGPAAGWKIRLYTGENDLPPLVDLINAAHAYDGTGHSVSVEELREDFNIPISRPTEQVFLVEGAALDGLPKGVLAGYGRIVNADDEQNDERIYQLGMVVHPSARGMGLEDVIGRRLIERAREVEAAPGTAPRATRSVIVAVREQSHYLRDYYRTIGLKEVRNFWVMERDLREPIPAPKEVEGIVQRPYRKPEDNGPVLTAYDASFADHFEFHAMPREFFDYMIDRAVTRTDLSWVAEVEADPGVVAGFCLCEVYEDKNARKGVKEGWIALVGTIRAWRGKGLGRSLLVRGMRSLKDAGMDTALLGVDSESPTGANRLYESVGFRVRQHEYALKCALEELTIW